MEIGNYEIVEQIGAGAMGVVYKARHLRVRRTHFYALKLMHSVIAGRPDLVARFHREIEVVGRLEHPNIVNVVDAGEHQGSPYLVMEYLQGDPLEKYIHEKRSVAFDKKLEIMAAVCRGLDYAHKQGVVHRDIKPANIILLPDLTPKIVDFGVAHIADHTMTKTGLMVGTVSYMSPEQLNGARVDGRSDIFSTTIVFYEFLSNHLPFEGADTAAIMKKILMDAPPPLREFVEPCPLQVEMILAKGFAKEPSNRYATALDMATDLDKVEEAERLREAAADAAMQATVLAPAARKAEKPAEVSAPQPTATREPRRGRFCSSCGKENPGGSAYCISCGRPLTSIPIPAPAAVRSTAPPPKEPTTHSVSEAQSPPQPATPSIVAPPPPPPPAAPSIVRSELPTPPIAETAKPTTTSGATVAPARASAPPPMVVEPATAVEVPSRPQVIPAAAQGVQRYLALLLLMYLNFLNGYATSLLLGARRPFGVLRGRGSFLPVYFCYLLALPLLGYWADRKFRNRALAAGASFLSALFVPAAVGPAYLSQVFPAQKIGRILSIFYLSFALGPFLGYCIYQVWPYSGGYDALSGAIPLGILIALIFVLIQGRSTQQSQRQDVESGNVRRNFAASPAYWLLVLGFALLSSSLLLMHEDLEITGTIAIVAWLGIISVAGGWLADRSFQRKPLGYLMVPVLALVVAALLALLGANQKLSTSVGFMVLGWLFLVLCLGPIIKGILAVVPPPARTMALAVNLTVSGFVALFLWRWFYGNSHYYLGIEAAVVIAISAVAVFCASLFGRSALSAVRAIQVNVSPVDVAQPSKRSPQKWLIRLGAAFAIILVALGMLGITGHPGNVRTITLSPYESIDCVAFSKDGRFFATGSSDHTIILWDASIWQSVRVFKGHTDSVRAVAFSSDGKYLASGGQDDTVRLWDVATGNELRSFTDHTEWVRSVAFSPNSKCLATAGNDKTIRLRGSMCKGGFHKWDEYIVANPGDEFSEVRSLSGHTNDVLSLAFSPDGKQLASGSSDDTIKIWDVANARELQTLSGHHAYVSSVAFSPDGRSLASGSFDMTAKVWDVATGQELRTLRPSGVLLESVAFSPDGGSLATAGGGPEIELWNTATGLKERTFHDIDSYLSAIRQKMLGNRRWVDAIAFSPDGHYIVTGESSGTINLWDLTK